MGLPPEIGKVGGFGGRSESEELGKREGIERGHGEGGAPIHAAMWTSLTLTPALSAT